MIPTFLGTDPALLDSFTLDNQDISAPTEAIMKSYSTAIPSRRRVIIPPFFGRKLGWSVSE